MEIAMPKLVTRPPPMNEPATAASEPLVSTLFIARMKMAGADEHLEATIEFSVRDTPEPDGEGQEKSPGL